MALIAGGTGLASRTSARADDRRVDGAVEGLAATVGDAGRRSRLLQTGLAHHYYLLMAVGVVVLAATVAIWRTARVRQPLRTCTSPSRTEREPFG